MRWNMWSKSESRQPLAVSLKLSLGGLLVGVAAGCAHLNDPYRDSGAAIDGDMITASSEGYSAKPDASSEMQRSGPPWLAVYKSGAVTHWPVYTEDPFEDLGNRDTPYKDPSERDAPDNVFAWNWVDYFHIAYGPARYCVNLVGSPASLVLTPPGTLMESDGRVAKSWQGYVFDEHRSDSAMRDPPDVSLISGAYQPADRQPAEEPPPPTEPANGTR